MGLVNRIVPANCLTKEVGKLAAQLAQGPTLAYGGVDKLLEWAQRSRAPVGQKVLYRESHFDAINVMRHADCSVLVVRQ